MTECHCCELGSELQFCWIPNRLYQSIPAAPDSCTLQHTVIRCAIEWSCWPYGSKCPTKLPIRISIANVAKQWTELPRGMLIRVGTDLPEVIVNLYQAVIFFPIRERNKSINLPQIQSYPCSTERKGLQMTGWTGKRESKESMIVSWKLTGKIASS